MNHFSLNLDTLKEDLLYKFPYEWVDFDLDYLIDTFSFLSISFWSKEHSILLLLASKYAFLLGNSSDLNSILFLYSDLKVMSCDS